MSVVSARLVGVRGKATGKGPGSTKRSYTARYQVETSNQSTFPPEILDYFQQTPDLPWMGRPLSLLNIFETEAVCNDVDIGEREKGSATIWPVTATFEPLQGEGVQTENPEPDGKKSTNPLQWHDEIDIGYQPISVAVRHAKFLRATNDAVGPALRPGSIGSVRDSAGMSFIPPPETEEYIKIIRITRKQRLIFGSTAFVNDETTALENTVNASAVTIDKSAYGAVFTIKEACGLLMPFQASFQVANGKPHWSTTLEVHVHPRNWRELYLDEGYFGTAVLGGPDGRGGTFSNTNPIPSMKIPGAADVYAFRDAMGNTVLRQLNGKGQPKTAAEDAVYLLYEIKAEKDWTGIAW